MSKTPKDYNYNIHIGELVNTLFCSHGYCLDTNERIIKTLLFLKGMDVEKGFTSTVFTNGEKYRTKDNQVVAGGILYSGYERHGYDSRIGDDLLNSEHGVEQLADLLGLK